MTDNELKRINLEFEGAHPGELLAWAWETFQGSVAASSSFQTQSG